MRTCTRRIEFDAAHRVMKHESKCSNLHGHRYVVEVTCGVPELDGVGRVIDFSIIKGLIGAWVDREWDHGALLHEDDVSLLTLCIARGWKCFALKGEPTAENIAAELHAKASELLRGDGVRVERVRVYETPNCWADYP